MLTQQWIQHSKRQHSTTFTTLQRITTHYDRILLTLASTSSIPGHSTHTLRIYFDLRTTQHARHHRHLRTTTAQTQPGHHQRRRQTETLHALQRYALHDASTTSTGSSGNDFLDFLVRRNRSSRANRQARDAATLSSSTDHIIIHASRHQTNRHTFDAKDNTPLTSTIDFDSLQHGLRYTRPSQTSTDDNDFDAISQFGKYDAYFHAVNDLGYAQDFDQRRRDSRSA